MRAASRTKPVGEALEVDLIDLIEDRHHGLLDDFVFQCRDGQCELHLTAVCIWDGPRYVIRSIPFEAGDSRCSSSGALPALIPLSSVSPSLVASAFLVSGPTVPFRLSTTISSAVRGASMPSASSSWLLIWNF